MTHAEQPEALAFRRQQVCMRLNAMGTVLRNDMSGGGASA